MKKGDKVVWVSNDMPGEVVGFLLEDPIIQWQPGYDSLISGGTYSSPVHWIGVHIELVGNGNGHKPKVPDSLIDPRGRDLFQEAFQLSFEL